MLAGNVSPMTGENVKPAYGGEDEAFLRKVVTPIYDVIAKVLSAIDYFLLFILLCLPVYLTGYSYYRVFLIKIDNHVLLNRKLHGAKRVGQSIHNGGTMMI